MVIIIIKLGYLLGLPRHPLSKSKLKQMVQRLVSEDSQYLPVLKKNAGKRDVMVLNNHDRAYLLTIALGISTLPDSLPAGSTG